MGCGGYGDGLGGPVQATVGAGLVNGWEARFEELGAEGGGVQDDGLALLKGHLAGDAAGDDVTGGELGGGVKRLHEADAIAVAEDGAFTADGF